MRFDPHGVRASRRRKSSLRNGSNVDGALGTSYLQSILGNRTVDCARSSGCGDGDGDGGSGDDREHRDVGKDSGGGETEANAPRHVTEMTRSQLHDMVRGLREVGRKYCSLPSTKRS